MTKDNTGRGFKFATFISFKEHLLSKGVWYLSKQKGYANRMRADFYAQPQQPEKGIQQPEEGIQHPRTTEGETVYCHLTEEQLRTIYKRFGHPLASRFAAVLKRAEHEFKRDLLYNI
ncbi:hypothetical protein MBM_08857 [Drepanopeziza brunnea f. sp. 'multigermtubi' MB_m1]|uniref:Uncharacterized protein n=1 Tax=Marssonina brunnea f. sp. multigermtubi (strain MB_m1) TaxID=1072389 RepID=K1W7M5_MARBU|nr:uncharacterized protein MBM_08857 [Drepanopeziza brunnea f. sp. 'multigermtubi' MB_m1]EKD13095.1 hypothetical protein MBM_08857 [Drepanopeziza brunnea f. sp. 'multigermtubi' MB_m1]